KKGVPMVVAKMGKEGVLVWDRSRLVAVPVEAAPATTVDVTGAGDAFCGGFAAGLAQGLEPLEAARRGSISAAFATEGFGSLALTSVTPSDAKARLACSRPTTPPDGRYDIKWMLEEIRL